MSAVVEVCGAHATDYPGAHTCDDPAACAVASLVDGDDPRDEELESLHELLDRIEEMCGGRKTVRTEAVLAEVHSIRGGPR